MKINEAINEADSLEPNQYTYQDKITWLSRLDLQVKNEVFDTHHYNAGETPVEFEGYSEDDGDVDLLVGEPFAEMYIYWLSAQINYHNREYDGFNAANAMFDSVYQNFKNKYHAEHKPKGVNKRFY